MGPNRSYVRRFPPRWRSVVVDRRGTPGRKTYIAVPVAAHSVKLWQRGLLVFALAGLLFGMGVHYGAVEDDRWPYPDEDALATQPAAHVGEAVFLFGTVTGVDTEAGTATVSVETDTGQFTLTVTSLDATVHSGGVVQVLGELTAERTVDADRVVVVSASGGAEWYKYGVSVIGAVLVLAAFFRHWRIDRDTWTFEVRRDG